MAENETVEAKTDKSSDEVAAAVGKTVEFDGETYEIPANPLDDVEVMEAWEDEKFTVLLRCLLGPAQWRKFKSKKRTQAELWQLIQKALTDGDAKA